MDICPLCGEPNNCAMEQEKKTGLKQDPCWCVSMEFPKELLATLPSDAKACICNACVERAVDLKN